MLRSQEVVICSSGQTSCGLSVQQELSAGPTSAQQKMLSTFKELYVNGVKPSASIHMMLWMQQGAGLNPCSSKSSYSSSSLQRKEFDYILLSSSETTALLFSQEEAGAMMNNVDTSVEASAHITERYWEQSALKTHKNTTS